MYKLVFEERFVIKIEKIINYIFLERTEKILKTSPRGFIYFYNELIYF